ncbi:MAG TPA: hypothetical protein VGQ62_00375 [Chloroflexota bacterium]|jgi:hypothetical protein|nr:hypothetical protein [Chloroflexota bacterium]
MVRVRRFSALLGLTTLLWAQPVLADQQVDQPAIRAAIESVIELDPGRQVNRLPRVTLDPSQGDLTIVFAMRRPLSDDASQIVASALDDILTLLWATYASDASTQVRTTTVIGTYAVVGRYARAREIPLVRAVLSADRARQLDWAKFATLDPREAFDVWWLEGELAH